jgi:hypothetical protein
LFQPRIVRSPAAAREITDSLRKGMRGLDAMMSDAEKRK